MVDMQVLVEYCHAQIQALPWYPVGATNPQKNFLTQLLGDHVVSYHLYMSLPAWIIEIPKL